MEYNKLIAELHTGDDVEGFYVLKDAFLKTTAAGKPFLSGVLADRSGVIDLKVWDYSGPIGARPDDIGRVVKIRGQVSEFKGAPQLTAGRIRMADGNDQYDLSALVPTAPIDADARVAEIERMIDSMEDREYQSVARTMLARHLDAFRSIPAAKSVHHSFLSGLLMHTLNMLRLADFLAALPEDELKAECLLPTMMGELTGSGRIKIAVLSTNDRWFGLTYKEDKPGAVAALTALHENGTYPPALWRG